MGALLRTLVVTLLGLGLLAGCKDIASNSHPASDMYSDPGGGGGGHGM
jgi:hypothetical protein